MSLLLGRVAPREMFSFLLMMDLWIIMDYYGSLWIIVHHCGCDWSWGQPPRPYRVRASPIPTWPIKQLRIGPAAPLCLGEGGRDGETVGMGTWSCGAWGCGDMGLWGRELQGDMGDLAIQAPPPAELRAATRGRERMRGAQTCPV